MNKVCSIPGCTKRPTARGWCKEHYMRWRRHGDPLGGRPTKTESGEAQRYFRDVVLNYEGDECLFWPFNRDNCGRGQIWFENRERTVSRLVCEIAHGQPPTPYHVAAHSCGNGHEACCTKRHLAWKTRAENNADKIIHGTHTYGEKHPMAKLTEADVREIRALRGTLSQEKIGARFGISQRQVSDIHCGRRWGWLDAALAPEGK